MYLVIGLILIVVVYFYFSSKNKTTTLPSKNKSLNDSQGTGKGFLPPMPNGYQIFAKNFAVAGIQHRKDAALKFARSSNQELSLERELSNKFDSNAIKLIGISGSTQYFIGYLPKELSAQIIGTGMYESVKARLGRIYISNNDFSTFNIK